MTLEILYPELCCLYGESANARYLKASVPELTVIETHLDQRPAVLDGKADMVIMGAMTENGQELALARLIPLAGEFRRAIEEGKVILATGNAMELFGKAIWQDGKKTDCMGIFDYEAERDMLHRHNSMFLGKMEYLDIVGCKSQYSRLKAETPSPLFEVLGGFGTDLESKHEGFRHKNFFGTYVLGPLLILNPPFTKYLLSLLGWKSTLAFEKEAMEAYDLRLNELRRPGVNFKVGEHG